MFLLSEQRHQLRGTDHPSVEAYNVQSRGRNLERERLRLNEYSVLTIVYFLVQGECTIQFEPHIKGQQNILSSTYSDKLRRLLDDSKADLASQQNRLSLLRFEGVSYFGDFEVIMQRKRTTTCIATSSEIQMFVLSSLDYHQIIGIQFPHIYKELSEIAIKRYKNIQRMKNLAVGVLNNLSEKQGKLKVSLNPVLDVQKGSRIKEIPSFKELVKEATKPSDFEMLFETPETLLIKQQADSSPVNKIFGNDSDKSIFDEEDAKSVGADFLLEELEGI